MVLPPVINQRFRSRKIPERRSCWIQHKIPMATQWPVFVAIAFVLESWVQFGSSVHFNSGADWTIQPTKNWLWRHQRQKSKVRRFSKKNGKIIIMYRTWSMSVNYLACFSDWWDDGASNISSEICSVFSSFCVCVRERERLTKPLNCVQGTNQKGFWRKSSRGFSVPPTCSVTLLSLAFSLCSVVGN